MEDKKQKKLEDAIEKLKGFTYEIKVYTALCSTEKFIINGINADSRDFGYQEDISRDNAEQYGCGNMRFKAKVFSKSTLRKYHINESSYNKIAEELEEKLSFGRCGWCV